MHWITRTPLLALLFLAVHAGSVMPATAETQSSASANISLVRHVDVPGGTGGGRIIGKYFYVSTAGGMRVYDISSPTKPKLLGGIGAPMLPASVLPAAQEDPDTDGNIFLSDRNGGLEVIDVSNERKPRTIAELDRYQHTWSCIDACAYAYGADGAIVDLRNPADPRPAGNWQRQTGVPGAHDVTRVNGDLAVVSTTNLPVLDVRDPRKPRVITAAKEEPTGYVHGNIWPRNGEDRFLIVGTEQSFTCNASPAAVFTYDTSGWEQGRALDLIDEYRIDDSDPQSSSPANTLCGHWFDVAPSFKNRGLVAVAWYEDGLRLLEVDEKGAISERGYYIRDAAQSSAAYWVTDSLIYLTDYRNGFDILRVKRSW